MKLSILIKKYLILFVFILSFLGGTVSQLIRIVGHKENDHWVYYRTASRIENKNITEIYSLKDGALPFRYSPPTLMLFSWMSHYDEVNSRRIWLVIQALFILAGLRFLYLVLVKLDSAKPMTSILFSFLLFYGYFLDSLFCGQVSGIVFFVFSLGLYFWVTSQRGFLNVALIFLFMLKIIPGFMIIINLLDSKNWKESLKMLLSIALIVLGIHGIYFFWFIFKFGINNISEIIPMFKNWISIVLGDQHYFDGSTLKSQSLRGAILRIFGSNNSSELVWKTSSVIGLIAICLYWFKLKMTVPKVRVYAYSVGVLAFVLLMPESLPYQVFKLSIPLVFIVDEFISTFKKRFGIVLFLVLIFCTLSTSDLIGSSLAHLVQHYSLPFFMFAAMGLILTTESLIMDRQSSTRNSL